MLEVQTGKVLWIDLGPDRDIYLARVDWLPDSKRLAFQRQTRDQRRIDLIFADVVSGKQHVVVSETSNTWTNLNDDLFFCEKSDQFLWTSEKTGFRHIYLYNSKGEELRALTSGSWPVSRVVELDEERGMVYFEGSIDSPLENHLYALPLAGGTPSPITSERGWHNSEVSAKGSILVDSYSSSSTPPQIP